MINEKLGVPNHIIDSAKKIWDETIKKVDMYYNQLKENDSVDFYVTNLKISDFKIKSVKVKFNVKYTDGTDKPVLAGMSIPAILAIIYPCLCLNLGFFLLITYNLPFLRTIMQSALLFFTDALTFILMLSLISIGNSCLS